jgi:undecaprenyl-diphosphatase
MTRSRDRFEAKRNMKPSLKDADGVPSNDPFQNLWRPLLAGAFVAAMAFVFLKLGSEVVEGETQGFDQRVWLLAQTLNSQYPLVTLVMRDLTSLGSTVVMTLITTVTVIYLALFGSRRMAALVLSAMVSGSALVSLTKGLFGRARPDLAFAELTVSGLSFPSGHASMSALAFLTMGALIAATRRRTRERIYILLVAGLLTLLVGISRVTLGVHWATDVIGGWAFGAAWAVLWLQVARVFSQR